jgi:hypothetical protein
VSRLDFAPKLEAIEIIDIKQGLGKFTPRPDRAVSSAALKQTLKKAGYKLDSAEITVVGTLARDDAGWWVEIAATKQRFLLEGEEVRQIAVESATGASFKVTGEWQTVEQDKTKREVIRPAAIQKIALDRRRPQSAAGQSVRIATSLAPQIAAAEAKWHFAKTLEEANRQAEESPAVAASVSAPIRTTSPGLTVYHGGGFMPRYVFTKQHLSNLEVTRQALNLSLSYTPTSTLQLEAQVPFTHTSFTQGLQTGSGQGFGNLTLWGKYRFYRTLETWGDKQAAVRLGVELPTGKKDAPDQAKLQAPAFVRQQLTPINNGWAAHLDTAYSQARHRWIYGANVEGTLRAAREGYRLGHELRLNTDLEFVLLPFQYHSPTKELFVIFETSYLHRGAGRISGAKALGSKSDEFYLSPGLQYIASQRFVVEASYQLPVVRNTGAQVLRSDSNFLLGVRYLY